MDDINRRSNLLLLAKKLLMVKSEEEVIRRKRIAIEEEIAYYIPSKETGQRTETLPDGLKITVKRGLNYKADLPAIRKLLDCKETWHSLWIPIKSSTTETLDVIGYEWCKANHPEIFRELSKHVAITPKKVSVIVKAPKE